MAASSITPLLPKTYEGRVVETTLGGCEGSHRESLDYLLRRALDAMMELQAQVEHPPITCSTCGKTIVAVYLPEGEEELEGAEAIELQTQVATINRALQILRALPNEQAEQIQLVVESELTPLVTELQTTEAKRSLSSTQIKTILAAVVVIAVVGTVLGVLLRNSEDSYGACQASYRFCQGVVESLSANLTALNETIGTVVQQCQQNCRAASDLVESTATWISTRALTTCQRNLDRVYFSGMNVIQSPNCSTTSPFLFTSTYEEALQDVRRNGWTDVADLDSAHHISSTICDRT